MQVKIILYIITIFNNINALALPKRETELRNSKDDRNITETEHHFNKRYYGKNQNRKGSNDVSVLVKRKVEKAEKVEKTERVEKKEHHLNKRYYGKNQNKNGSNDKSVLVRRKIEKMERVEKTESGVHQNRNRSSIN